MADTRIVELMAVPVDSRDTSWLRESLQAALELELSTLPVYLSGIWSIKNQSGEVYDLINSVVLEEMLHLGLACNMLTAVGGTPKIVAPVYPGHLPGGVLPKLDVYLGGLSATTLDMYLAIEEPEHPLAPPIETDYPTIDMFYDAIAALFQALSPSISTDGQLTVALRVPNPDGAGTRIEEPLTVIASLPDALAAIKTIKDQGEGTSKSPDSPGFGGELAHYYRFGEIRYGRRFVEVDGKWGSTLAPQFRFRMFTPSPGFPGVGIRSCRRRKALIPRIPSFLLISRMPGAAAAKPRSAPRSGSWSGCTRSPHRSLPRRCPTAAATTVRTSFLWPLERTDANRV